MTLWAGRAAWQPTVGWMGQMGWWSVHGGDCVYVLALISPTAIQAGQTGEKNMLRNFQCAACHHGNPFSIIPVLPEGMLTSWGGCRAPRKEQQGQGAPGTHGSTKGTGSSSAHLGHGDCNPIHALALALGRKAAQPPKSLRVHARRKEVTGHQEGTG